MIDLDGILLVSAVVLIVAILAARVGARVGLPSLLLFLGIGLLMGDSGISVWMNRPDLAVDFNDANMANALGFGALVLILAEGGLTTRWHDIRPSIGLASSLATLGVGVSVGLMTLVGYYVLDLNIWLALLLGAVTSPTDAAAVFSVLRRVPIPRRLRGSLEAESGLNDAPTVLLVVLASDAAVGHGVEGGALAVLALIVGELVGGVLIGGGLGWVGVQILRRVALPSSGLYPLAALVWSVFTFAVGAQSHTSGFAAVYVCALMLGNAQLPHRAATRSFVEGIGWIAQIGLFIMLGLLATPTDVKLREVLIALGAGTFLTFVARPISVWVSTVWFGLKVRDQIFLSWAGLRGAVPIVLATIPRANGVPGSLELFNIVLVFVIVFTFLQAPTLPFVARVLRLAEDDTATDLEVEAAPLDKISADLLQVRIPANSRLSGIEISELRLDRHTVVSLIIREGAPFVPEARERIKVGDELLIVTPSAERLQTEDRLRALARGGRLARWREDRPTAS
ncbi:MAG TPA: potassium/proton antiporter [Propionibacteriaceae bacterium]|nr:potassium/proton antiporter [Propionibacteriaceae bacterium]